MYRLMKNVLANDTNGQIDDARKTGEPRQDFYCISEFLLLGIRGVRRLSYGKGQTYSREIWHASSGLQSGGVYQILSRSIQPFRVEERRRRFQLNHKTGKPYFVPSTYTRTLYCGHVLKAKFRRSTYTRTDLYTNIYGTTISLKLR